MTSVGIILSWFRLLTFSAMLQMARLSSLNTTHFQNLMVAENCTLNITDFKRVQKLFKEYTRTGKARLIDFRISGIMWSDSSNETVEVFDPNRWSWVAKGSEFLTQMPIDYHIVSFGLSRLAMMDLEVNMVDFPSGCVDRWTFELQRRRVMKELLHLTYRDGDNNDLICRSTYSRRSLLTDSAVGVGTTCCTRGELQDDNPASYECDLEQAADHEVDVFSEVSPVMIIAVILLSIIIMPLALTWLHDYNQMYFTEDLAEYVTDRLQKWSYFSLERPSHPTETILGSAMQQSSGEEGTPTLLPGTRSGELEVQEATGANERTGLLEEGRWGAQKPTKCKDSLTLLIADNDLVPYKGPVSILDLLDVNMSEVAFGKMKITVVFILHLVLVAYWLTSYGIENETLRRLESTEKILFNLYGNPYSWLWTDNSLFPFYLATVLFFLNALLLGLVTFWWLLELQRPRLLVAKCFNLYCAPRVGKKMVFKVFFSILVISCYVSVYSTFNSIIYAMGGLIASIDKTLPWLTFAVLCVYYIQQSYQELVQTYTQIKGEMFTVCTNEENADRASHVTRADVIRVDYVDKFIVESERIDFQIQEFYRPVLFTKYRDKQVNQVEDDKNEERSPPAVNDQENGIEMVSPKRPEKKECTYINQRGIFLESMLSKSTLRGVCERVKPIKANIRNATLKLGFILVFLVLVLITMTVFHPNAATTEARLVITSIPPLLIVLIRWLAGKTTTNAEEKLENKIVKNNIKELLPGHRPTYIVKDISPQRNKALDEVQAKGTNKATVTAEVRARGTTVKGSNPRRGADELFFGALDHYDKDGMTRLMKAAKKNEVADVRKLIKAGADFNLGSEWYGVTAMMFASMFGHKEVVAELIKAGAGVNIKDVIDRTAVMYASEGGHKKVAAELIKAGADVNINDWLFNHHKTNVRVEYSETHELDICTGSGQHRNLFVEDR